LVTDNDPKDCAEYRVFIAAYEGDMGLWNNTSGKADKTPDFFSQEYETMMEVMRVDDHAYMTKDGKLVNPAASADSKKFNELIRKGIVDAHPDACFAIIGDSGLPTLEDHNYLRYKENFKRIVNEHISKISTYRKNHPECRYLIFLIFDESCGYFEAINVPEDFKEGVKHLGRPHIWFEDKAFTDVFVNSDVDCVIWYTPYKYSESRNIPGGLPQVSVFFKSCGVGKIIDYDESHVMPTEV